MSINDKIADIIAQHWCSLTGNIDQHDMADAILEALPDMIAPLVWGLHALPDILHHYSDHYTLICMADGYLVDFDDLSLGHGCTLEQAKSLANTHHRAAIMAAFKGETQ
jgi:hypothetical protein